MIQRQKRDCSSASVPLSPLTVSSCLCPLFFQRSRQRSKLIRKRCTLLPCSTSRTFNQFRTHSHCQFCTRLADLFLWRYHLKHSSKMGSIFSNQFIKSPSNVHKMFFKSIIPILFLKNFSWRLGEKSHFDMYCSLF